MPRILIYMAGLGAWTFLEYVIHGWMSHRFKTFATPLHASHHRDPSAVFTLGAWLPSTLVMLVAFWFGGPALWVIFYAGIFTGFVIYEAIHYRIHFREPANRWERHIRAHHLVHHLRRPRHCYGVTSAFWDRTLGTDPDPVEYAGLAAQVAAMRPLQGKSNFGKLLTGERSLRGRLGF